MAYGSPYADALKVAGAIVHQFKEFGSYQGDWWALVDFEGKRGWVHGYYGSCSGCDAFEAESGDLGWVPGERTSAGEWIYVEDSAHSRHGEWLAFMAAFGRKQIDDVLSDQQAVDKAGRDLAWDVDAEEMVDFIIAHASTTVSKPSKIRDAS